MTEINMQGDDFTRLRELSDPEFMTQWAAVRSRLFFVSREDLGYPEIKRRYDAVREEYRRRMRGGLAEGRKAPRRE